MGELALTTGQGSTIRLAMIYKFGLLLLMMTPAFTFAGPFQPLVPGECDDLLMRRIQVLTNLGPRNALPLTEQFHRIGKIERDYDLEMTFTIEGGEKLARRVLLHPPALEGLNTYIHYLNQVMVMPESERRLEMSRSENIRHALIHQIYHLPLSIVLEPDQVYILKFMTQVLGQQTLMGNERFMTDFRQVLTDAARYVNFNRFLKDSLERMIVPYIYNDRRTNPWGFSVEDLRELDHKSRDASVTNSDIL